MLTEREFRELSVEGIMAAAGMSRPTFYHYFDDLADLLLQLLAEVQLELLSSAEPWLSGASEGPEALRNAISRSAGVWMKHRNLLLAVHDGAAQDPRLAQHYRGIMHEWATVTADRLRAERRRGRTTLSTPYETAAALTLMNINVFAERLGRDAVDSPAVVGRVLSRIWISTIYPGALDDQPDGT